MDTAKVDIRRLQLLCDRINQTIEALNQVRMSVHGLTHSNVNPNVVGLGGIPSGVSGFPIGVNTFGVGATNPFASIGSPVAPFGLGAFPQGVPSPWGLSSLSPVGINHSAAELSDPSLLARIDPFLSARLVQTFPFCFSAVPGTGL
jgi:hypothetical protein